jgi:hypothetical protein
MSVTFPAQIRRDFAGPAGIVLFDASTGPRLDSFAKCTAAIQALLRL